MPPAKKKLPRCSYSESDQRCRRAGSGVPPFCAAHRIVIESEAARPQRPGEKFVGMLGRLFRGQKISDDHLYGGLEDVVGMFSRPIPQDPQSAFDAARAAAQRAWQARQAPGPAPRPQSAAAPAQSARDVLGFSHGEILTEAAVKKRYRELARRHHPDRGGDVRRMAEINQAVDELLASL